MKSAHTLRESGDSRDQESVNLLQLIHSRMESSVKEIILWSSLPLYLIGLFVSTDSIKRII